MTFKETTLFFHFYVLNSVVGFLASISTKSKSASLWIFVEEKIIFGHMRELLANCRPYTFSKQIKIVTQIYNTSQKKGKN